MCWVIKLRRTAEIDKNKEDQSNMKTIKVETVQEAMQLLVDQPYDEKRKIYRNLYVYRGIPNVDYKLLTSLYRNCGKKQKDLEQHILDNFSKYAELEAPTMLTSVWKRMILGQHHGLPTRLLDWTRSPLVALHFAMTESDYTQMDKHDAVVWKIDIPDLKKYLPDEYRKVLDDAHSSVYTMDQLDQVTGGSLDKYDNDMGASRMVILEPPSMDQRVANQYSFFSVVPSEMRDVDSFLEETSNTVKYIISKDIRWHLRDALDQMNINERMIYPGLDGVARVEGRHYYVRNESER